MSMIRGFIVMASAAVLTLVGACRPNSTVASDSADDSPRLVVLSPGLAITLMDLGASDLIVGRHAWDMVLDRDIPSCGDQSGIDYERLITVRPTQIVMERPASGVPARLVDMAAQRGWEIVSYPMLTLADLSRSARDLQQRFASDAGADPIDVVIDRAMSPPEGLKRAGRVLLVESTRPRVAVLGPGSWHGQILERLGATPALASGGAYVEMDAEDVVRLAPDVIVLVHPRSPDAPAAPMSERRVRDELGVLADLDVPAVREGRVAIIDDPLALTPSTAMIDFADDLAEILAEWVGRPEEVGAPAADTPRAGG